MKKSLRLLLAAAVTLATTAAVASTPAPASPAVSERGLPFDTPWNTEHRTKAFLNAFDERDFGALGRLVDRNARLVLRLPLDGSQDPGPGYVGRDQVVGYFRTVTENMPVTTMVELRISASANGRSSFVQFEGDFRTADGRPYRNVYIWRMDWRRGQVTSFEEYGNPITYCLTFPGTPGCAV